MNQWANRTRAFALIVIFALAFLSSGSAFGDDRKEWKEFQKQQREWQKEERKAYKERQKAERKWEKEVRKANKAWDKERREGEREERKAAREAAKRGREGGFFVIW
jgi:uncharacterized protein YlxW (UPF0749 family)